MCTRVKGINTHARGTNRVFYDKRLLSSAVADATVLSAAARTPSHLHQPPASHMMHGDFDRIALHVIYEWMRSCSPQSPRTHARRNKFFAYVVIFICKCIRTHSHCRHTLTCHTRPHLGTHTLRLCVHRTVLSVECARITNAPRTYGDRISSRWHHTMWSMI